MPRLPAGLVALFLLCSICAPAHAAATEWSCWYDGDTGVLCVPVSQPAQVRAAAAISGRPWKLIRIPLMTIPTDIDGVRRLVRAVMCGRPAACSATFEVTPDIRAIEALDDDE